MWFQISMFACFIFLVLCSIIVLCLLEDRRKRDGFKFKQRKPKDIVIVLLGDELLDNSKSVGNNGDVKSQLQIQNLGPVKSYAKRNATIESLGNQIINYIKSSSYKPSNSVVISIGAYDIVNALRSNPASDPVNSLFMKYKKLLEDNKHGWKHQFVILAGIPIIDNPDLKRFASYFQEWNKKLKMYTDKHNYQYLDTVTLLNDTSDFDIVFVGLNLSASGSLKLVSEIEKMSGHRKKQK